MPCGVRDDERDCAPRFFHVVRYSTNGCSEFSGSDDDVALIVRELDDRVLDRRRAGEAAVEQIALRAVLPVTDSTRSVTPMTASGSVSVSSASRTSRIHRFCSALGRDERMRCVRCVRLPSRKTSDISRARSPRSTSDVHTVPASELMTNSSRSGSLSPYSTHSIDALGNARKGTLKEKTLVVGARALPEPHAVDAEPHLDRLGVERGERAAGLDAESLEQRREMLGRREHARACTAR